MLSGEISRETLSRNCWRNESRAWIEVRGLGGDDDGELGRVVLDAIRAHPGVTSVSLNHPLSRAVVDIDDPGFSLRDLCRMVEDAEKRCGEGKDESIFTRSLPGDGVVLATRALTVAVNATGLGVALDRPSSPVCGRCPPPSPPAWLSWTTRSSAGRLLCGPDRRAHHRHRSDAGRGDSANPHPVTDVIGLGAHRAVDEGRRGPRAGAKLGAARTGAGALRRSTADAPVAAAAAVQTHGAGRGSLRAVTGAQRRGDRCRHPQLGHGRHRGACNHPQSQPDHARGLRHDPGPGTGRPPRGIAVATGNLCASWTDRHDRRSTPGFCASKHCAWHASAAPTTVSCPSAGTRAQLMLGNNKLAPRLAHRARDIGQPAEL